jgi:hypothetical protein
MTPSNPINPTTTTSTSSTTTTQKPSLPSTTSSTTTTTTIKPSTPPEKCGKLKIGSFNIQVFGKSKMAKTDAVKVILKVLQRWDLVLVQEVRDSSETAIYDLHKQLNAASGNKYLLFVSERLGRTASKEQYAWFYRKDKIKKVGDKQIADPKDHWQRPPQVTYWDLGGKGRPEDTVGIIGIHVEPDTAVEEIDELAPVMDSVVASGRAKGGVWVMGDLNADCSYITKTQWKCIRDASCTKTKMRLYNPSKYKWMIGDEVDTTTKATDCAYDRAIFSLPMPPQVSNVGVYDFGEGLTEKEITTVSDHYPIEFDWSVHGTCETDDGGGVTKTTTTLKPSIGKRGIRFVVKHRVKLIGMASSIFNSKPKVKRSFKKSVSKLLGILFDRVVNVRSCPVGSTDDECPPTVRLRRVAGENDSEVRYEIESDNEKDMKNVKATITGTDYQKKDALTNEFKAEMVAEGVDQSIVTTVVGVEPDADAEAIEEDLSEISNNVVEDQDPASSSLSKNTSIVYGLIVAAIVIGLILVVGLLAVYFTKKRGNQPVPKDSMRLSNIDGVELSTNPMRQKAVRAQMVVRKQNKKKANKDDKIAAVVVKF